MFPLAGKEFPTDSDELADSIREALSEVFSLPKPASAVVIDGDKFPSLKSVKINLTGASLEASEPPPKPAPTGKRHEGISVKDLQIVGKPIQYEQNQLNLSLTARDVSFDFARDKKGHPLLVLTDAAEGHVEAKISKADIESLLLTLANDLAKQQGMKIQDLQLELTSEGKRSVAADVLITAKKMMVSGTIRITGQLDVDDELVATISNLQASGEGMVGNLVSGIVQNKLKPHEGTQIPLMAFSLGDIALRDLRISVKNQVQVSADFGSTA